MQSQRLKGLKMYPVYTISFVFSQTCIWLRYVLLYTVPIFQSLVDNAIQGIIIGVTLAFPIITLTTMNVIIGLFATLSICCTTVCVAGVIPLAGWKLGVCIIYLCLNSTSLTRPNLYYFLSNSYGHIKRQHIH